MAAGEKAPDAFRTIGELSVELGVAQHILRYWESKFPQLRPLQRAGNRRYYRPADVALARRIYKLLNEEGYTVKGAQKALRDKETAPEPSLGGHPPAPVSAYVAPVLAQQGGVDLERLKAVRDRIAAALDS